MSFLFGQSGKRKYLTINERQRFLDAASLSKPAIFTFCMTLAYTGARISEVLALAPDKIDFSAQLVVIESLKKRRRGVYRVVPVPTDLLALLNNTHGIKTSQQDIRQMHQRIWPWCRTTAWKHVKACMATADIVGTRACPKALRHSLGVSALQEGVPLNMVKKWLGHSRLETTAIYADAM